MATSQPAALRVIRDEHLALGAVVYGLRYVVRKALATGTPPRMRLLHAMIDYIVRYPEQWHHPKEDRFLFARLVARAPATRAVVEGLAREHREGGVLIGELRDRLHALATSPKGLEASPEGLEASPEGLEAFAAAVERYAGFQWEHMRREEEVVFPLAEAHLTAADWDEIGAAFGENADPLAGIAPRAEAHRLYRRILSIAPAPIGRAG